jgi:hypothetical protein
VGGVCFISSHLLLGPAAVATHPTHCDPPGPLKRVRCLLLTEVHACMWTGQATASAACVVVISHGYALAGENITCHADCSL